jgi:hypothetical protein
MIGKIYCYIGGNVESGQLSIVHIFNPSDLIRYIYSFSQPVQFRNRHAAEPMTHAPQLSSTGNQSPWVIESPTQTARTRRRRPSII